MSCRYLLIFRVCLYIIYIYFFFQGLNKQDTLFYYKNFYKLVSSFQTLIFFHDGMEEQCSGWVKLFLNYLSVICVYKICLYAGKIIKIRVLRIEDLPVVGIKKRTIPLNILGKYT